jgi:hypothetical protein
MVFQIEDCLYTVGWNNSKKNLYKYNITKALWSVDDGFTIWSYEVIINSLLRCSDNQIMWFNHRKRSTLAATRKATVLRAMGVIRILLAIMVASQWPTKFNRKHTLELFITLKTMFCWRWVHHKNQKLDLQLLVAPKQRTSVQSSMSLVEMDVTCTSTIIMEASLSEKVPASFADIKSHLKIH